MLNKKKNYRNHKLNLFTNNRKLYLLPTNTKKVKT